MDSKFSYYLRVELAVCEAYNKLGQIPDDALEHIKKTASFDVKRIDEIEEKVRHDVIAFLTNVNENVGEEYSPYIHMGLTSSDVIDTAFALQIKDASDIINEDLDTLLQSILNLAKKHKNTVCLGRSHGIGAEVITFAFKLLNWYDMLLRAKKRFNYALDDVLCGQISGPVGTYSNVSPEVEKITCEILGLKSAKISTQVIARDRHSAYINALSHIACAIENFAVEIRHLQRWEVCEAEEGFLKALYGRLTEECRIQGEFTGRLPQGVVVSKRDGENPVWFLQNVNRTEERVELPFACHTVEDGRILEGSVTLRPYECLVLTGL